MSIDDKGTRTHAQVSSCICCGKVIDWNGNKSWFRRRQTIHILNTIRFISFFCCCCCCFLPPSTRPNNQWLIALYWNFHAWAGRCASSRRNTQKEMRLPPHRPHSTPPQVVNFRVTNRWWHQIPGWLYFFFVRSTYCLHCNVSHTHTGTRTHNSHSKFYIHTLLFSPSLSLSLCVSVVPDKLDTHS